MSKWDVEEMNVENKIPRKNKKKNSIQQQEREEEEERQRERDRERSRRSSSDVRSEQKSTSCKHSGEKEQFAEKRTKKSVRFKDESKKGKGERDQEKGKDTQQREQNKNQTSTSVQMNNNNSLDQIPQVNIQSIYPQPVILEQPHVPTLQQQTPNYGILNVNGTFGNHTGFNQRENNTVVMKQPQVQQQQQQTNVRFQYGQYQQQQHQNQNQQGIMSQQFSSSPFGERHVVFNQKSTRQRLYENRQRRGMPTNSKQIILPKIDVYEPAKPESGEMYVNQMTKTTLEKGTTFDLSDFTTLENTNGYVIRDCHVEVKNYFATRYLGVEIMGAASQLSNSSPFYVDGKQITFIVQPGSDYRSRIDFWDISPLVGDEHKLVYKWSEKVYKTREKRKNKRKNDDKNNDKNKEEDDIKNQRGEEDETRSKYPLYRKGKDTVYIYKRATILFWIVYFSKMLQEELMITVPNEDFNEFPWRVSKPKYDTMVDKITEWTREMRPRKMSYLHVRYHIYDHDDKDDKRETLKLLDTSQKVDKNITPLTLVTGTMKLTISA